METQQERIDKAIKKKEIRYTKTEISIDIAHALNCVVASLSEKEKDLVWAKRFELIEKRYQDFIDLKRTYIMDNLPAPEPQKLTRQDFVEAAKEAPEKQIVQRIATEIGGEEKMEEEKNREANKVDEINRGL